MQSPTKRCTALGCSCIIPSRMLMCARHWKMVPSLIQDQVYSSLRLWKNGLSVRPYVLACDRARLEVAEAEALDMKSIQLLKDSIERLEKQAAETEPAEKELAQ